MAIKERGEDRRSALRVDGHEQAKALISDVSPSAFSCSTS